MLSRIHVLSLVLKISNQNVLLHYFHGLKSFKNVLRIIFSQRLLQHWCLETVSCVLTRLDVNINNQEDNAEVGVVDYVDKNKWNWIITNTPGAISTNRQYFKFNVFLLNKFGSTFQLQWKQTSVGWALFKEFSLVNTEVFRKKS